MSAATIQRRIAKLEQARWPAKTLRDVPYDVLDRACFLLAKGVVNGSMEPFELNEVIDLHNGPKFGGCQGLWTHELLAAELRHVSEDPEARTVWRDFVDKQAENDPAYRALQRKDR